MALYLDIKVTPSSRRTYCTLDKQGRMRCFVTSKPEGGKANTELCRFIAKKLSIPLASVSITLGKTARTKRVRVEGAFSYEAILQALDIACMQRIDTM